MSAVLIRVAALWRKEALALLRDPHALAALFVMPAVFILIMSFALRDAFDPAALKPRSVLVQQDDSPAARTLVAALRRSVAGFDQARAVPLAEARRAVGRGEAAFAVVLQAGVGAAILGPEPGAAAGKVQILVDPTVAVVAQQAIRQQVGAVLGQVQAGEMSRRMQALMGVPLPVPMDAVALPAMQRADGRSQQPSAVQQSVPAWLIFGLFFVVIPLAPVFIAERQFGTLVRLRAMGASPGLLIAGKLPPFVLLNLLQACLMLAVGAWLVPALGGEALRLPGAGGLAALAMVSVAVSAAAIGWAFLVASIARTSEQATVIGGVGNILMAAIGGVMVPRFVMPAAMQPLTQVSPMAWALDAFHAVLLRDAPLADLALPMLALLGFGATCLTLAAWALRRSRVTA